jgi:hypothetical protein
MREIAEIELAIQGGTEKIESLGMCWFVFFFHTLFDVHPFQVSKEK